MTSPQSNSTKNILFGIISTVIVLIVISIIGEIVLRVFPGAVADQLPEPPYNSRLLNDEIGWIIKPNYEFTGKMRDLKNNEYPVHISFDENGFRNVPVHDTLPRPVTILFLGDSYTESVEVSNEKLFYSIIQDSLPVKVYGYGAAGYGNLQEYLILEKYIDKIKPDIVLWQLCTNDYIDNYCPLEKETNYRVGMQRPYLTATNNIVYDRAWLPNKHLREYSHFLYFLAERMDAAKTKITGKAPEHPGEKMMYEQDSSFVLFKNSIHITDLIAKKFQDRFGKETHLITYVSDSFDPLYSILKNICVKNNLEFIDSVGTKVQEAQDLGQVVRANDGYHWNEEGHKIVAARLIEQIRPVVNQIIAAK
ncbi:MAG: SGNH/GDSL hydrolase family protein [Chitinophagaceae bacterium]|nr:SGNH/GDSL hydrolase family protein [Chitinophagaceae bacterium]